MWGRAEPGERGAKGGGGGGVVAVCSRSKVSKMGGRVFESGEGDRIPWMTCRREPCWSALIRVGARASGPSLSRKGRVLGTMIHDHKCGEGRGLVHVRNDLDAHGR